MASAFHDRGTRFTNYSSIHSADAFVGEYQVMYTPGNSPPPSARPVKKSTRFSSMNSAKPQQSTASYVLPSNIPNTSQILPDQGKLPNAQIHYTIPADEKQIVASLRELQENLSDALRRIRDITRERDEALYELRLMRTTARKPSSPKKTNLHARVEEELFDISRVEDSPKKTPRAQPNEHKAATDPKPTRTISDDARILSPVPANRVISQRNQKRVSGKQTSKAQQNVDELTEDFEKSVVIDEATAASNTSRRRRRHSLEENMTSAYIIPDITLAQPNPKPKTLNTKSVHESHNHEDGEECAICTRLLGDLKPAATRKVTVKLNKPSIAKNDMTAQITELIRSTEHDEVTMRPRIAPGTALENLKKLHAEQYLEAKRHHQDAWEAYDAIAAPLNSKRHARAAEQMASWARKMEECRINLDQLRDVQEGLMNE